MSSRSPSVPRTTTPEVPDASRQTRAGDGNTDALGSYLESLFAVVIEEARSNPAFAARLHGALAGIGNGSTPHDPESQRTGSAKPRRAPPSAKPSAKAPEGAPEKARPTIHAVNVLRQHGETMLRGRLSNLRTKAELGAVARASGLRLTGAAARKSASREDLVDGIVTAAIQYDRQRESVDG
ncbi:MAG: hypothetical protein AAFQ42_10305 [Pseudomonadota bacterium]